MMRRGLQLDRTFGKKNEIKIIDYLNKTAEKKYQLYEKFYSSFDFFNEDTICELKSRRCSKDKYKTTIFGANKLDKMEEGKNYVFYFLFTDGLYSWNYNEDQCYLDRNGRADRGAFEFSKHVNIPVEHLQLVTKDITSY